MTKEVKPKQKSFFKKLIKNPFAWLGFLVALYIFVGFVIVPYIIKTQTVSFLKEQYKRESKIEAVSFNPFTFSLSLKGFTLYDKNKFVFVSIKNIFVDLNEKSLFRKKIEVDFVNISSLNVNIKKLNQTEFNFSDLIKPQEQSKDTTDILIKKFQLQNSNVEFTDYSASQPAQIHIDNFNVEVTNIRPFSANVIKLKTALEIREGGKINFSGDVCLLPVYADLHYDIKNISLKTFQPHLLQKSNMELQSGSFSTAGDVQISFKDNSQIPVVNYKGSIVINDLNLYDLKSKQRIIKFGAFQISGIKIVSSPLSITINQFVLKEFFAPVLLDPKINPIKALKSLPGEINNMEASLLKATNTNKKDFNFEIGEIKIVNSGILLTDISLKNKFTANIHSLNGEIKNISRSNPFGTILLAEGIVDKDGSAKIMAKLDLMDPLSYATLDIKFNNLAMTNFSPYTMQFLGYKIQKGNLSVDLHYEIKNSILVSDNKIFLHKLTIGEKVNPDSSLDFPVETAISILEDKNGNIDVDAQINGDLNNPEFNTAELVWWAVRRSFTSVIEKPISFLGELLGINTNELENVEFYPGESKMREGQFDDVSALIKILDEKPNVAIEIYGAVDTVIDLQALKTIKVNSLFAAKLGLSANDVNANPLMVDVKTSRKIWEDLYNQYFSANALDSLQKKFSVQINSDLQNAALQDDYINEIQNNLRAKQTVSQQELLDLGKKRADAINTYLSEVQQIDPQRLIVKETEIYKNEASNWVKCRLGIGPR
jgi:hypothetical protein